MSRHALLFLLPALMALRLSGGEPADGSMAAWTNRVGHVILAEPLGLSRSGQDIRLRTADGRERTFALSAFPDAEQTRLKIAVGQTPIPASLTVAWDFATNAIARTRGLADAGRTRPEDRDDRISRYREVLRQAIRAETTLPTAHRDALLRKTDTL